MAIAIACVDQAMATMDEMSKRKGGAGFPVIVMGAW